MQIAKYFASIGLRIDPASLQAMEKVFTSFKAMAESFDKRLSELEGLKSKRIVKGLDKEVVATEAANKKKVKSYAATIGKVNYDQIRATEMVRKAEATTARLKENLDKKEAARVRDLEIAKLRASRSPQLLARQGVQQFTPTRLFGGSPLLGKFSRGSGGFAQPLDRTSSSFYGSNNARAWNSSVNEAYGMNSGFNQKRDFLAREAEFRKANRPMSKLISQGTAMRLGVVGLGVGAAIGGAKYLSDKTQAYAQADLGLESVLAAYGKEGMHDQLFDRYKLYSHKIGVNWQTGANDFNSFMSSALGMGVDPTKAAAQYEGFSGYARAMHIDPYKQKLVMQGVRDMMGKGFVQAEEWKKQIGGNLPGGVSAMAEAYQKMTNGKLTGQEAIAKFIKDAATGKIKSPEFIQYTSEILGGRAEKALKKTESSSQTAQGRLQGEYAETFKSLDPIFANIYNNLSGGLGKGGGLTTIFEGFAKVVELASFSVKGLGQAAQAANAIWNYVHNRLQDMGLAKSEAEITSLKVSSEAKTRWDRESYTGRMNALTDRGMSKPFFERLEGNFKKNVKYMGAGAIPVSFLTTIMDSPIQGIWSDNMPSKTQLTESARLTAANQYAQKISGFSAPESKQDYVTIQNVTVNNAAGVGDMWNKLKTETLMNMNSGQK